MPYLDLAYQGFGDGIEADAYAVRALADAGRQLLRRQLVLKSMSVYGERCGALSVVCPDAAEAELVLGQLKATVRRNYSSPPHARRPDRRRVLGTPELRAVWEDELAACACASWRCASACTRVLSAKVPGRDFGYFLSQRGMFSYTGLTAAQVDRLRERVTRSTCCARAACAWRG